MGRAGKPTWANSSLSVPKAKMRRKSTPGLRGGRCYWVPRLSPSTVCFCLTFLGQMGLLQGHPQCLDYGPPFQPPLHLEFCSDYESFGCCDQGKDNQIAARYWDIMNYFDLRGHKLCGGYVKDILCQVGLSVTPRGRDGASMAKCLPSPVVEGAGLLVSPAGRVLWTLSLLELACQVPHLRAIRSAH